MNSQDVSVQSLRKPLVSVIIPVYNVAAYLEDSLKSVIDQTYQKLEILVIDDGSTDGSGEICDQFAAGDSRITVIHQNNRGLSSARNVGLDHAKGEIIAFLDPDDILERSMIQALLREMQRQDADIAICDFALCKSKHHVRKGKSKAVSPGIYGREQIFQMIMNGQIDSAVWNKLYVREIWNKLRFPDGLVYEGTYLIFDLFARSRRTAIVNEKLVMHRVRPGSITNTCSVKNIQDHEHATKHYYEFVEEHTPGLFSKKQMHQLEMARMRGMMVSYMHYAAEHPEDKRGLKTVRDLLIRVKAEMNADQKCAWENALYHIVLSSPGISAVLFSIYKKIRLT